MLVTKQLLVAIDFHSMENKYWEPATVWLQISYQQIYIVLRIF